MVLILAERDVAHGAEARVFTGANTVALGGTGRATLNYVDSISMNPAGLAFSPASILGFSAVGQMAVLDEPRVFDLAAIAVDAGADRFFPGAVVIGRGQREWDGGAALETLTGELSLGFSVKPGELGLGTTLIYSKHEGRGGLAIDKSENWNLRLGALWVPSDWLAVALVGQNLIEPEASTPIQVRTAPTIELGLSLGIGEFFRWRLEMINPRSGNADNRQDVLVGLEIPMLGDFVFRSGYRWLETIDRQEVALGFGWNGPRLKFSYGLSRARPRSNNAEIGALARHSVDLWVPF